MMSGSVGEQEIPGSGHEEILRQHGMDDLCGKIHASNGMTDPILFLTTNNANSAGRISVMRY